MTWLAIAKKDLRDAIRSKVLWLVSVLLVLLITVAAYPFGVTTPETVSTADFLNYLNGPIGLLVPLIALLLGYNAVAGESESGSMKLLLSLPHTRRDVIIGKLIGRSMVLSISISLGFAVATAVVLAFYPQVAPIGYVLYGLLTVVLGITYLSIGIGISAVTNTTAKAGAAIAGVYLLLNILWGWISFGIYSYRYGSDPEFVEQLPNWYPLFDQLSPSAAANVVMDALRDPTIGLTAQPTDPFYLSVWVALVILIGWALVPIALGSYRFQRRDL